MGVFFAVAEPFDEGGPRGAILKFEAVAEPVEFFVGQQAAGFNKIALGDVEVGVHDALGKLSIVGEEEQPAGIEVEASDRDDEGANIAEEIVDGGTILRVLVGGEVTFGLVEDEVDVLFTDERLGVEQDLVAVHIDPVIGVQNHLAVDGDPAGADPATGFGAGAEAGLRQYSFERF